MTPHLKQLARLLLWLLACLILLQLVAGLLLNHSKQLELGQRYLTWEWLMTHYGMGLKEADAAFLVDDKILSQFDTQLFVDASPVTHLERSLLGAIALEDVIVLATDQALILLNREGEYLDTLHAQAGIPAPIQNIGTYMGSPSSRPVMACGVVIFCWMSGNRCLYRASHGVDPIRYRIRLPLS